MDVMLTFVSKIDALNIVAMNLSGDPTIYDPSNSISMTWRQFSFATSGAAFIAVSGKDVNVINLSGNGTINTSAAAAPVVQLL